MYDIPGELPSEPQEWLFEVVVGLGGDLEILEVLFPVESDRAGGNLAFLQDHRAISQSRS